MASIQGAGAFRLGGRVCGCVCLSRADDRRGRESVDLSQLSSWLNIPFSNYISCHIYRPASNSISHTQIPHRNRNPQAYRLSINNSLASSSGSTSRPTHRPSHRPPPRSCPHLCRAHTSLQSGPFPQARGRRRAELILCLLRPRLRQTKSHERKKAD